MFKAKVIHPIFCVVLFGVLFGLMTGGPVALAAPDDIGSSVVSLNQEQPPVEKELELYTPYSVASDLSGKTFRFEIELKYEGVETKTFELSVTELPGWTITIQPILKRVEITQIRLQPGKKPAEAIRVRLEPLRGELPAPGEYVTELTASSGDIKASLELKAVVTDLHRFTLSTLTGRLNTSLTAGKENYLSVEVTNIGTVTLDRIVIVGAEPEQWVVKFNPVYVINLAPGSSEKVDILIKPPKETIAGDYALDIMGVSSRYSIQFELRGSVLTPAIWRLVGILIVLATLAGVVMMYRQLARR